MHNTTIDMTKGDPIKILLAFSLPALVGNLLHQAYSITDSIIVGRKLGQTALAAVGCTAPIVMLLAALMVGVNIGVGILLSQYFGRRDFAGMRKVFVNSLYFGLGLALVMAIIGFIVSEPLLRYMGTPEEPLHDADIYLKINFITTACPLLYYLFSCVFRGMGDSRTGLYCLIVSVLTNIILDILFVAVLDLGVAGSAWATALAQALSAMFAGIFLWKKFPQMRFQRADLKPDRKLVNDITRLATPIALQSAFNNIGNIVAQSAVNTFGEAVMAAYTAAGRIGTLALMPLETVGSSLSIYSGQNFGAGEKERIDRGVNASLKIVLILSIVLGALLLLCGNSLAGLFLENPTDIVLEVANRYLLITAVPGVFAGIMHVYQQVLRGVGYAGWSMSGGVMQLICKVAVIAIGAWCLENMEVIWLAWPMSFIVGTIAPFWYYMQLKKRDFDGKEKNTKGRK